MVTKIEVEGRVEYLNEKGELHREDGPACEYINGSKSWWINGKRHREDGPAIERSKGSKEWWLNGLCHREDGPAVVRSNGNKEWYLNGEYYTEQEHQQEVIKIKLERLKSYGN
jgi:hypothetical protein